MINVISAELLMMMIRGAAGYLDINKVMLNALNVFPVPDGDTGTNMGLTMASCVREMQNLPENATISQVSTAFATGSLRGARGNSGVILSQILKGMGDVLSENTEITTKIFAKALSRGSDKAYDAVTKPKEGTILTVIRLTSEYAVRIAGRTPDFQTFFEKVLKKGEEVLNDTPNMLAVLKQAGVVDAGGKGLIVLLQGMQKILNGEEIVAEATEDVQETSQSVEQNMFFADVHNLEEIEFAYCTEFFIINIRDNAMTSDIDKLRDKLMEIGDCVVVVGDLNFVKVHVHTNQPNLALGYALSLGELDKLKIENMLEQNREMRKAAEKAQEPKKKMAMLAVSSGDGLTAVFKDIGVDAVVAGGQTMNTSVSDFVEAANKINAETVFILPNNKNIILAAEQAIELAKPKIVVIATKSVPEGISAALAFDPDGDVEDNTYAMQKTASSVKTGQVTHSVRDVELDGFKLKRGDIIGLDSKVIAQGNDVNSVAYDVVTKLVDDNSAVVTLYYGEEVEEEYAAILKDRVEADYPAVDVMAVRGGQPHYSYLVAVE